jgi:hypothetical protein
MRFSDLSLIGLIGPPNDVWPRNPPLLYAFKCGLFFWSDETGITWLEDFELEKVLGPQVC